MDGATSREDSSSDEDWVTTRKRKPLKSGMDQIGATMVLKCINWSHEASDKPAAYDELTVAAFLHGYLIVVNLENSQVKAQRMQHLKTHRSLQLGKGPCLPQHMAQPT